ncbi:MAG: AAA domain-containing protein, partial [Alphaproteobacteria bacterium]
KLEPLHSHADLFHPASPFANKSNGIPRARLAHLDNNQLDEIETHLKTAAETRQTYEEAYTRHPLDPNALDQASELLSTLSEKPLRPEWLGSFLETRIQDPDKADELEKSFATLDRNLDSLKKISERVLLENPPANEEKQKLVLALAEARRRCSSFFKFLQPAWHRAVKTIRQHLIFHWPEKSREKISPSLLADIETRHRAAEAWSAAENIYTTLGMRSSLPRKSSELSQEHQKLLVSWQASQATLQQQSSLEILHLWPLQDSGQNQPASHWADWLTKIQSANSLHQSQTAYYQAIGITEKSLPAANQMSAETLRQLAADFSKNRMRIQSADALLERAESSHSQSADLLTSLAELHPAPADFSIWTDATRAAWAEAHLAKLYQENSQLNRLSSDLSHGTTEETSARLLDLHQRIAAAEATRISKANDQRGILTVTPAAYRARRSPEQAAKENLIRECRKQRRVTPLRTLVRRHANDGILDVLPVWLMSPETTAILFPRQPVFDLLIIDEASQCTVENGLPVLTRARRAVIAGDDKQMPPTSFFKASAGINFNG